ncbi:MAG: BadF/BadG/BcrA/BcrD ATPase family protein, partial [Anaerotardibacter sp.]
MENMVTNSIAEPTSTIHLGVDVGSTTTKVLALDPSTNKVLYTQYIRHHAYQADSVIKILQEVIDRFPQSNFRVSFCGSGGKTIATYLDVPYIQEVVANALAVRTLHPGTQSAIELGGQDAKMIFFHTDEETGNLSVSDMRMNGSCAGGTGAFIDEIAALLKVPIEEFNELASQGTTVYDVSGRCGVYAKTDIQPLLNQGVPKSDIALSAFHAIAKQSIGGLAQGIVINPPVIFEGGPLTFNPTLIDVFKERLCLSEDQVICPDHPETIVARGAALSLAGNTSASFVSLKDIQEKLAHYNSSIENEYADAPLFFENQAERDEFTKRHQLPKRPNIEDYRGQSIKAYLGIDSGSTTTKFALVSEDGELIDSFYSSNEGEPLDIATEALLELKEKYALLDIDLEILGVGTTGYGELLFNKAYHCDYHTVETGAHTKAATKYVPEASFIL